MEGAADGQSIRRQRILADTWKKLSADTGYLGKAVCGYRIPPKSCIRPCIHGYLGLHVSPGGVGRRRRRGAAVGAAVVVLAAALAAPAAGIGDAGALGDAAEVGEQEELQERARAGRDEAEMGLFEVSEEADGPGFEGACGEGGAAAAVVEEEAEKELLREVVHVGAAAAAAAAAAVSMLFTTCAAAENAAADAAAKVRSKMLLGTTVVCRASTACIFNLCRMLLSVQFHSYIHYCRVYCTLLCPVPHKTTPPHTTPTRAPETGETQTHAEQVHRQHLRTTHHTAYGV